MLTLFKITYDESGKPVETSVQTWELDTNDEGTAESADQGRGAGPVPAGLQGHRRKEHTIEGGYVFTVIGEGFDGTRVSASTTWN